MEIGRIGIVAKGNYNPELSYKKLDFVTYDESSYLAKEDILIGEIPSVSNKWQLACKKGDIGQKGLDAYQHWLANGNVGNVQEFLASYNTLKKISTLQVDFPIATTAVSQVPEFTLPIKAGRRYKLTGFLWATTLVTTTGVRFQLGLIGGGATIFGYFEITATATTAGRTNILALDTVVANNTQGVTTTAPATGQPIPIQVEAVVNCISDGEIGVWFGSEIASSQVLLKSGSFIQVEEF